MTFFGSAWSQKAANRPSAAKKLSFLARFSYAVKQDRRAGLMTEFALVGPIFFVLLFFTFDTAYNEFSQAALDAALQSTVRQIQVGAAQGATTGPLLVTNYLCPNAIGLLNCNNLYVRVESINQISCPGGSGAQDIYNATDGLIPANGNALALGLYSNPAGSGLGGSGGPTICQNSTSSTGFCVPGPSISAPVLIVLSAVYVTPSFLGLLAPRTLTYNGNIVRASFSSAAFITEGFSSTYTGTSSC